MWVFAGSVRSLLAAHLLSLISLVLSVPNNKWKVYCYTEDKVGCLWTLQQLGTFWDRKSVTNTTANLQFVNNISPVEGWEELNPKHRKNKCRETSRSQNAPQQQQQGGEANLGTTEAPMSRGDKEQEEAVTIQGHSETGPQQNQPAVVYFLC